MRRCSSPRPARPAYRLKAGLRKPLKSLVLSRLSRLSLFQKILKGKSPGVSRTSPPRRVAAENRDKRDKRDAARFFNGLVYPASSDEAG